MEKLPIFDQNDELTSLENPNFSTFSTFCEKKKNSFVKIPLGLSLCQKIVINFMQANLIRSKIHFCIIISTV